MADQDYDPVDERVLRRMVDAGVEEGTYGGLHFSDGEQPNRIETDQVQAMAQELLDRRSPPADVAADPPVDESISGMVVIEPHEIYLDSEALIAIVKERTMDMAAALLEMAADHRARGRLQ